MIQLGHGDKGEIGIAGRSHGKGLADILTAHQAIIEPVLQRQGLQNFDRGSPIRSKVRIGDGQATEVELAQRGLINSGEGVLPPRPQRQSALGIGEMALGDREFQFCQAGRAIRVGGEEDVEWRPWRIWAKSWPVEPDTMRMS